MDKEPNKPAPDVVEKDPPKEPSPIGEQKITQPLSTQDNEVEKNNELNDVLKTEVTKNDHDQSDKKNASLKKDMLPDTEQKKTIEKANINEHSSKFIGAGLWEQIRDHTRNVEIGEESDFFWPENRKFTEDVIEQLSIKHILFIQSISEDWLFRAVQRLASVLHASSKFENLLVRITRNSQVMDNHAGGQLEFGFWNRQRPLPYPVVIFISASRYDFLQKFLDQRKETVLNEFIAELKKLNLYLVCEVENSVPNRELFSNAKSWIREVYAFWNIPVVRLQIMQNFKRDGLDLYKKLEDDGVIGGFDEFRIYGELLKRSYHNIEDIMNNLSKDLNDTISEVGSKRKTLEAFMEGEDFIRQLVIFCGAFFNGLYYPDFYWLVSELLEGETKDLETPFEASPKNGVTPASATPVSLKQSWEKNADRFLKECMLKTTREGGNQRVDFKVSRLATEMSNYIRDEQYPFFHRIYKKFEKAGLLTNLALSEKMESYIIRFFALAARMDTNTHNAWWLKNVVYRLWRGYAEDLTPSDSYDEMISFLRRKKAFAEIVFNRIPLIISGLLTNNNEEYREIIKHFFRLLLSEHDAKKMAIIIASYLYKEYRLTETFSTDDLMSYFRRTLEEGNWEESFFSYDALRDNMSYTELWDETNAWIENKDIKDDSWTKQFAYLYQLDFILETFYRYFRQFKGEGLYELWENTPEEDFPESFKNLVKRLLSVPCQKSLAAILENEQNSDRFYLLVKLFEGIESDKIILVNSRLLPPHNTAISLVADVLEIWFYILTHKYGILKPDSPVQKLWEAYAGVVVKAADTRVLSNMNKCWSAKIEAYTLIIHGIADDKSEEEQQHSYKKQLQKRRASLRMLKEILQQSKSLL